MRPFRAKPPRPPVPPLSVHAKPSAPDIEAVFELVIGRKPDPGLVQYHLGLGFATNAALAAYLLQTDEFRGRYEGWVGVGGAPGARPDAAPARGPFRPSTVFLGDRVLTTTHRNHRIYLPPGDVDLAPHIMLAGVWEEVVERAVLSQIRPGHRVADVGANVGYHMLAMASAVGAGGVVHAFEASPRLVELLRATIAVNGIGGWTTLHHRAVSDAPGTLTLAAAPNHFGSGNLVPPDRDPSYDARYPEQVEVEAVTLDVALAHLPSLDLLRMDIEGAEPAAIAGTAGLLARSPDLRMVLEWSVAMMGGRCDLGAFVRSLGEAGFRPWLIPADGSSFVPLEAADLLNLPHSDVLFARSAPL